MSIRAPEIPETSPALRPRPSILLLSSLGILCTMVSVVFARLAYGLLLPATGFLMLSLVSVYGWVQQLQDC